MRTQRSADMASGLFLALLGLLVVAAASRIAGSPDVRLHPQTLPRILGWTILAAGIVLGARAWGLRRGGDMAVKWPDRAGALRVLITLASLTVYLTLLDPLGMPLSTVLFVAFLMWYLGRYRMVWAAALGLASGVTVYIVFIRLLQLTFPVGPLSR